MSTHYCINPTGKPNYKKFIHLFNIISGTIILLMVGLTLIGLTARTTLADGPVEKQTQAADLSATSITGSNPWIWILCKFADDPAEPQPPSYFQTLSTSLNSYFQEVSYNKANITGSNVVDHWYTLPYTRGHYVDTPSTRLDTQQVAQDCTAAADADVNFANYYGLNMMLNGDVSYAGLTTRVNMTLDGVTKQWPSVFIGYRVTTNFNMELTAHEMYHGFGLDHSAVHNADGTYLAGNQWDPVGTGACGFGSCNARHLPAPQKDELGWIDADKIYNATLATQTISLEALALPQTSNYLMAKIPLEDSRHFYTLEARRSVGWDSQLPGPTVLIHEVNLKPNAFDDGHIGLIPVPGKTSPGSYDAMWTVGTSPFTDGVMGITVTVVNTLTTGFQVRIEARPIQTKIIYVKANAGGANNGTSWVNAYTDLQSALAAANPTGRDRVEIWIAQGTYRPTSSTDRNVAFGLKNSVGIYGGFGGITETARSQRNIAANPTFLSGDLLGNDNTNISYDEPTRSDNSYHVITDSAQIFGLLDGVIITGGNANGASDPTDRGGGMYNNQGSSILRNVTFLKNTATYAGGGMANYRGSPYFVNVTFVGNKSNWGGGVNTYYGTPRLTQVIFSGNTGARGGGLCNIFGNVTLVNVAFSGNTVTSQGGGVYNYDSEGTSATTTITNSILGANSGTQLVDRGYGTFNVSYSLLQGGYTGTGNISSDPLFVDADGADNAFGTLDDNLRLPSMSPAVDGGSNSAVPADDADVDDNGNITEQTPYDMDGRARFMPRFISGPLRVDMGVYETSSISGSFIYLPVIVKNQ